MDYSFIGAVLSGIGAIISVISMFKAIKEKKEVVKIKNSIINKGNFTGFANNTDLKDCQANQINIKK